MKKYFQFTKKTLFILLTLGIFGVSFFIGYFLLCPAVSDYAHRTPFNLNSAVRFNSISWKNENVANNERNSVRLRMVNDLLKKYKFVGMSRNQINELLGIPEPTGYFRNFDYVYWLGPERGFISIDSEWLGIKFRNNVVIDVKTLRD